MNTTEVGHTTRLGAFLSFSFAFCKRVNACRVLPRPISSANIPFKPYLYKNHNQLNPLYWYSLSSALTPFGSGALSIVENVEICFQKLEKRRLIFNLKPRFCISDNKPARYVFTMYLLSSFLYTSNVLNDFKSENISCPGTSTKPCPFTLKYLSPSIIKSYISSKEISSSPTFPYKETSKLSVESREKSISATISNGFSESLKKDISSFSSNFQPSPACLR